MKKPGRKTACILGCIAAAAVLAGLLLIMLNCTRIGTDFREAITAQRSADPAFAGLRNAVQHTRNVRVDLSESKLDSETGTIRIYAQTETLNDTVRAVQNVHAYLADTEDAPERAYKIILDFHLQDDCIPQNVRYYNFSAADDEPALTLFRCEIEYDLLRDSEIEALSSMTFLRSLDIQRSISHEALPALDPLTALEELRIRCDAGIPPETAAHLKEAHPDCRITINGLSTAGDFT